MYRLKRILIFLLIVCFSTFVYPVTNKSTQEFPKLKTEISRLAYYQSQEKESLITDSSEINYLLKNAIKTKDTESELRSMIALAVYNREKGEFKQAFRIIEKVIQKLHKYDNPRMQMVAYNNYAIVCRRVERLNDATKYHLQALKLAELYHDPKEWISLKSKCVALNGLGNIALSLKQFSGALLYFSKAISIEKELGSMVGQAINHANIGGVLELKNMPDSALVHYQLALEYNTLGKSSKGVAICRIYIGDILMSQHKSDEAMQHYSEALQITDSIGDIYHWLNANNSYTKSLIDLNRLNEAKVRAMLSVSKSKQAGIWFYLSEAYLNLARIYEIELKPALSFQNFKLGIAYKDSISTESNFNNIQDLQLKYETEKKEQQIVWLEIQEKNHRTLRNILALLILVLIGFVAALWVLARYRKRNMRQKELLLLHEQQLNKIKQEKLNAEIDLKNHELASLATQLATKNEVLNELRSSLIAQGYSQDILSEINTNLTSEKDWEAFYLQFIKIHPHFFSSLKKIYPEVSAREERLCAYLRINMSSKEIASILNVTIAAVDKSRNRLRKKLNIASDLNLTEIMKTIENQNTTNSSTS